MEYELHLALWRVSSDFHSVFFCDFHTVICASHKSERTSCIFIFSKTNSYFQGWFYKIPGQFQDKRHFLFQDQGQIFPGLCEPCKSMSHIICHINPQIQFVDMCCGHWISLTVFIHCDLDLRSQFLKKMHPQQITYLFMVAFHIWYVVTSWTLAIHQMFPGHCDLDIWFQF